MRILVVHSFYRSGLPSGENDVVRSQVRLLRDRGFETELWGPTSPDEMGLLQRVRVGARVASGRGLNPKEVIQDFRPDLIHVHNVFPNVAVNWLADCAIPMVMSIHNYRSVCANGILLRESRPCTECLSMGSRRGAVHGCYMNSRLATLPVVSFQRHLRRALADDVDLVVFNSEPARDMLEPHLNPRAATVLPNYVADVGIEGSSGSESDGYFVVVGRLSPEKGVDRLLRMWPSGRRLIVMGDGPERLALERQAGPNVQFVGFVGPEVRDPLLRGATGLILPSITLESDPVVIAQALSAGTACVVSEQTSSARLARETPAVRIYHDEGSLVDSLEDLVDPKLRREARATYLKRWSMDAWMAGYESKVIRGLVKERQ